MDIQVHTVESVTVVAVTGSIDGLTADRLHTLLEQQVAAGNTRLVADCGGLAYTSSAGLRALLATVKRARGQSGDLRLAAVQPPVMRVLELAGFTTLLKIFPDVTSATKSFG